MNYLIAYSFLGIWTWGILAIVDYSRIRHFNILRLILSLLITASLWPLLLLGIFISQANKVDEE